MRGWTAWVLLAPGRWRGPALVAVIALAFGCEPESVGQPSPVPCAFVLSASTVALTAAGGSGSVSVSTEDRCAWTARANVDWISITGGANSVGSGTAAFTASANSETSARTGTLTIADKPVSVTEDAAVAPTPTPCTFAVSPTSATFDKRGGTDHVTITAPETCRWTVASSAAWLHITSGAEGTGNGTVTYAVDANVDPAARASTIAVADKTIAISQPGDLRSLRVSISVLHFSPCMPASEMTTTITTAAACPWTASSNVSWMAVTRGGSTVGSGVAGFTVAENYDLPRAGQILVRWPAPTADKTSRCRRPVVGRGEQDRGRVSAQRRFGQFRRRTAERSRGMRRCAAELVRLDRPE